MMMEVMLELVLPCHLVQVILWNLMCLTCIQLCINSF